jgi:rhodanese-related sulfurtransferase
MGYKDLQPSGEICVRFLSRLFRFGFVFSVLLLMAFSSQAGERELKVMITPELGSFHVLHNGKRTTVIRNQNRRNRIADYLALTSRECPPHCLQPIKINTIETVGELEVVQYLRRIEGGDRSVLVVDTRFSDQVSKGTIPGSVNVYGNHLIAEVGANPIMVEEILTGQFGVSGSNDHFDFSKAKTLVVYCYGIWCGQGPRTLRALLKLGYPAAKLKWYRGGIQAWESVGLTAVRNE